MVRRRITVKIKGEAYDALMSLSKKFNIKPNDLIHKILINQYKVSEDNMLCQKDYFDSSIIYQVELPFAFPYECEVFDFEIENRKVKLYVERVPKRYVIDRLPFRTVATIIIELKSEEESQARHLIGKYVKLAYNVLKATLIAFRRITGVYYNMGEIDAPVNIEDFQRKCKAKAIVNRREIISLQFMPVKEDSFIEVRRSMDQNVHKRILKYANMKLVNRKLNPLEKPLDYLDSAQIFFYHEQWNLALIQSVIAMEAALSKLVFKSQAKQHLIRIYKSEQRLRKKYTGKLGLPEKIKKFLFPLLDEVRKDDEKIKLEELMPNIKNIYSRRNEIIHEGSDANKKEAEKAINTATQFLNIISNVLSNIQ
ncbi:MAG: hypothetical protein NDF54_09455 [archaeon GB-1867-035]|nr:hypothetical protein [Candidatus Culexmicrobium profundum]